MDRERCAGVLLNLDALAAVVIRVEDETAVVGRLEKYLADRWLAGRGGRGQGHRFRQVEARFARFPKPPIEEDERIGARVFLGQAAHHALAGR